MLIEKLQLDLSVFSKSRVIARYQWLTPVILEAEIKSISVQSQPWGNSFQDPLSKKIFTKGLVEWFKV
jgi:hypothetical protein